MNQEAEILEIKEKLEQIWSVLQQWPNNVGLASNLEGDVRPRRFRRTTSKEEIRQVLAKQWNQQHPQFKVTN